jgi:xylose isomerase
VRRWDGACRRWRRNAAGTSVEEEQTVKSLRHAAMPSSMGRQIDRFREYQPERGFEERLEMVKRIPGVEGIEVVYPGDFADREKTVTLIRDSGLSVSAVNLNVKSDPKWQLGAFAARDPGMRAQAVADLKAAMELAAELHAFMVTCCPLIDGHNYSFEADYSDQWKWLEEGIGEGARSRPEVKVSIEYKRNECRNYVIVGDMGRTLYLCERLGLPNVGVTLDIGHALIAKESPAEMLCLAHGARRLFYLHCNDNAHDWDWDMIPGTVCLWDLVETLYYVDRLGWHGWVAYDVSSRECDPQEAITTTLAMMEAAEALLERVGYDRLRQLIADGVPGRAFRELVSSLAGSRE